MTHTSLTQTVLFSSILILTIIGAGCTSLPQPNTNTTTITNTIPSIPPTPNPYDLDTDGYYIADFGHPNWNESCYDQTGFNNTPDFTVKLLTPTITSGEALLFEGATTCPPHSRVYITKDPHYYDGLGSHGFQEFSAPVLPGTNGTNIIKFKIPAFNIHIDASTRNKTSFPANETYTSYISVGMKYFEFTIISDPNYPMIWDTASRSEYTWMWTNDTTKTKYTRYFHKHNRSENKPAPTYPKLNNTFM